MVEIEDVQDVTKTSINKDEDTSSMRRAAKKKQKKKKNTKKESENTPDTPEIITKNNNLDKNNVSSSSNSRDELRKQLRSKIYEKSIGRSNKLAKDNILNKTLNDIGIDKKTFMESVDTIKKAGGFSLDSNGNIVP